MQVSRNAITRLARPAFQQQQVRNMSQEAATKPFRGLSLQKYTIAEKQAELNVPGVHTYLKKGPDGAIAFGGLAVITMVVGRIVYGVSNMANGTNKLD